jgi:hypothetical protein
MTPRVSTKVVMAVLAILPLGFALCAVPFLSDTVTIHWTGTTPDGFGSKWFLLLVPGLLMTVCNFLFLLAYQNRNNEKLRFLYHQKFSALMCFGLIIIFDVISVVVILLNAQ